MEIFHGEISKNHICKVVNIFKISPAFTDPVYTDMSFILPLVILPLLADRNAPSLEVPM